MEVGGWVCFDRSWGGVGGLLRCVGRDGSVMVAGSLCGVALGPLFGYPVVLSSVG